MAYSQANTFYSQPGLILLLNARTVVSLVGIVFLVVGNFWWNRIWESYHPDQASGSGAVGNDAYHAMGEGRLPPRFNKIAALGWGMLAFSYLLDRRYWMEFDHDLSMVHYLAISLILAVGALQSFLIPRSLVDGSSDSTDDMKVVYVSIFCLSILTDGFLNTYFYPGSPSWMGPLGAVCITCAPYVLFLARRKGEAMESEQNMERDGIATNFPEHRVYVFNLGGPLTVIGWFLWWVSMNCVIIIPNQYFLQIFISNRTYVAFAGAALVVTVHWMVGYALDATPPTNNKEDVGNMIKNAPAFGAGTVLFGDADEIPVAMALAWGVFGFCVFLPFIVGWEPFVTFTLLLGVGFSFAMQQTNGTREHDMEAVTRWGRCADVGMLLSAVITGVHGRATAVALMFVGFLMTSYGVLALRADCKIGRSWLQQQDTVVLAMTRDRPQVYSYGALAFPLGMIVLAWGLSIDPF
eukprot:scaffold425_cov175-Amphora_coffeaeformis.AAC.46